MFSKAQQEVFLRARGLNSKFLSKVEPLQSTNEIAFLNNYL